MYRALKGQHTGHQKDEGVAMHGRIERVDERRERPLRFLLLQEEVNEVGERIHDSRDFEIVDGSSFQ